MEVLLFLHEHFICKMDVYSYSRTDLVLLCLYFFCPVTFFYLVYFNGNKKLILSVFFQHAGCPAIKNVK